MSVRSGRVIVGDAATELRRLPSESVDMVLTSPPYFRLRDYQVTGQLGLEPHVDQWVDHLRTVSAEIARVLTPTGSFWLNVCDTYATHSRQGAERKSLLLGPERLLIAMQQGGWIVRNKIIWAKTNPMPVSVRDRMSCTHESLYLLTRCPDYFFDLDAIRIRQTSARRPTVGNKPRPRTTEAWRGPNSASDGGLAALKLAGQVGHPLGKNPGDVWRLATSGYRGHHHATFPVTLAERVVLAGSPESRCTSCRRPWRRQLLRDLGQAATRGSLEPTCACAAPSEPAVVLDPFFGVGTTGVAAERHHRSWLGIELNPSFADLATRRIADARAGPAQRAA